MVSCCFHGDEGLLMMVMRSFLERAEQGEADTQVVREALIQHFFKRVDPV